MATDSKPTLASLLRHAKHYGPEGVYEVGEENLPITDLLELARELNGMRIPSGGRFKKWEAKPLTRVQQERLMKVLIEDGIPNERVATAVGVSPRTVSRFRVQLAEASVGQSSEPIERESKVPLPLP